MIWLVSSWFNPVHEQVNKSLNRMRKETIWHVSPSENSDHKLDIRTGWTEYRCWRYAYLRTQLYILQIGIGRMPMLIYVTGDIHVSRLLWPSSLVPWPLGPVSFFIYIFGHTFLRCSEFSGNSLKAWNRRPIDCYDREIIGPNVMAKQTFVAVWRWQNYFNYDNVFRVLSKWKLCQNSTSSISFIDHDVGKSLTSDEMLDFYYIQELIRIKLSGWLRIKQVEPLE